MKLSMKEKTRVLILQGRPHLLEFRNSTYLPRHSFFSTCLSDGDLPEKAVIGVDDCKGDGKPPVSTQHRFEGRASPHLRALIDSNWPAARP